MPYSHVIDKPHAVRLKDLATKAPQEFERDSAPEATDNLAAEMEDLFDLLYYAGEHALLIVLQGMDTSGKDGTIRHILNHSNAQSCKVAPFKVPTPEELAHDYLWRVHHQTPGHGGITIFNRSHYEDVLVVRVHKLVPEKVWKGRYEQINAFEQLLASAKTIVLKFFLHISSDEQEQRLREREQEVEKSWKLSVGDWKERELWDDYQDAYADAIGKCASPHAPWHVVPADQKWFRNLAVTEAIVDTLRPYRAGWLDSLKETGEKAKAELAAYRAERP